MTATPLNMPHRKTVLTAVAPPAPAPRPEDTYEPYCFVCSRPTDHVGEHEALVEAGLASYDRDGSVRRTSAWDADAAAAISQAEFETYMQAISA